MDLSTDVKIVLSRMGAELRRVERKIDIPDEKVKMALSLCKSLVDCVDGVKGQVGRVRESWRCWDGKIKEMEEQKMMEESLNNELDFHELVEERESQQVVPGKEEEGDGIVQQGEDDNMDNTED